MLATLCSEGDEYADLSRGAFGGTVMCIFDTNRVVMVCTAIDGRLGTPVMIDERNVVNLAWFEECGPEPVASLTAEEPPNDYEVLVSPFKDGVFSRSILVDKRDIVAAHRYLGHLMDLQLDQYAVEAQSPRLAVPESSMHVTPVPKRSAHSVHSPATGVTAFR